jgi:hypothetical protein
MPSLITEPLAPITLGLIILSSTGVGNLLTVTK